jgi:SAM-dependent methyltransferase
VLGMTIKDISPWELLQKKMTWEQLKFIHNKRILDFGSGNGMTADHFAIDNEVIAIEPDEKMLKDRFTENNYIQIKGNMKELKNFQDESFDVILCHNVFEYADTEILEWSNKLKIERILGMRTFGDLQQNQEIQKDKTWQEQMLEMELKVSELEEYKAIASFHHVILRKK